MEGEGVSEIIVKSYKANGGKKYICYIPSKKQMEMVGENIGPKPDELIETNVDYPERNIIMVRECDSVIALNGGIGTLTEIIHAIKDYSKKVSVIDLGELSSWIKSIPELRKKVFLTLNINKAIEYIISK
ncbi:MAG: LOG family protein [Nanoarchaeota archaeon]|nr:LOG family protein [Nanoarchaeota archaeon]MBU4116735.1 LOG family protein [Nanoarchaeota archaeon]